MPVIKGGILFFLGHGSSDNITWNLNSAGITRLDSPYNYYETKYLPIASFSPHDTALGIYMGCNTALNKETNIAKTAYEIGNKTTMGWVAEISDLDTGNWVNNFYSKLATGATVLQSYIYAGGFNYNYNENMKTVRIYGSEDTTLSASAIASLNLPIDVNDVKLEEPNKVEYDLESVSKIDENQIAQYIKEKFNPDFDINNYKIETSGTDTVSIYDFSLMLRDFKTSLGYTAIIHDKKMTIIDNMKNWSEKQFYKEKIK